VRWSPRRPPPCRKRRTASATGTIAYSWIRDSTLALWSLYTLGFDWEANDFFRFIADVAAKSDELQIMYGSTRRATSAKRCSTTSRDTTAPVPCGSENGAFMQKQHDVWGSVLDSVYIHWQSRDRLDEQIWPMLKRLVESALTHWREPDRGIWEVRGSPDTSPRPR